MKDPVPDKPPFPRWLVKLDPTLEMAENNALFMAFHERRLSHSGQGRARVTGFLQSGVKTGGAFLLTALLIPGLVLIMSAGAAPLLGLLCVFVPLAFVLERIWHAFARRVLAGSRRMPWRASDVFMSTLTNRQVATDLWMAGVTGAEVLEALYLERARRNWPLEVAWGVVLVALAGVALWFGAGLPSVSGALLLVLGPLVLWRLWRLALLEGSRQRLQDLPDAMKPLWVAHSAVRSEASIAWRNLRRMLTALGPVALGLFLFLMVVSGVLAFGRSLEEMGFDTIAVLLNEEAMGWAFLLVSVGYLFFARRTEEHARERNALRMEKMLRSATAEAFGDYMRVYVAGDVV